MITFLREWPAAICILFVVRLGVELTGQIYDIMVMLYSERVSEMRNAIFSKLVIYNNMKLSLEIDPTLRDLIFSL